MKNRYSTGWLGKSLARRMQRAMGIKSEEGTALVEFAVTLPLLMMVLTGTASFSLALYFLQQIGNATAGAAQTVGEEAIYTTDPCATVVSSVTGSLPNLSPTKLTYTVAITDSSSTVHTYGPTTGSSFSCTAGATYLSTSVNHPVSVTVKYTYTWLPILKFSPSSNLTSQSTALAQ